MEYPGARFTRPLRLTLLFIFIGIFLVATPVVLLFTAGYRYDWRYGFFKETGSISVDILPKNATAYLNGLRLRERLPIRLNNITPGKHLLRLAAPGHYEWEKEVEVKNKQTVYIKDIQMLKKNDPELLSKGKINYLALSPSGHWLLYALQNNEREEIWLRDITTGRTALLTTNPATEPLQAQWSRTGEYAVIHAPLPTDKMLMVKAERPENIYDLGKKIGAPINKALWRAAGGSELYLSSAAAIFSFAPSSEQLRRISPHRWLDWYLDDAKLWTLSVSTSTSELVITKDYLGFPQALAITAEAARAAPADWRLRRVQNDSALIANNAGQAILVRGEDNWPLNGATVRVSPYNRWWLIWTPTELWSYTQGEPPNLLIRSGKHLRAVAPLDKFNTLALLWEDKTTVLFPYYYIQHDLLTNKVYDLAADAENRVLYFSGKILGKEGLWKLEY